MTDNSDIQCATYSTIGRSLAFCILLSENNYEMPDCAMPDLARQIQAFETNAIGGSLAYHTKSTKRMNMYGNRSISSPDVMNFWLLSTHKHCDS